MQRAIGSTHEGPPKFYSQAEMEQRGVTLDPTILHMIARDAWADIRAGKAYGLKSVLLPKEDELWLQPAMSSYREKFKDQRLGWKLSTLSSVGSDYAAVKIVGANALNRHLGRPRSTSTIALFDKISLAPLCLMEGTDISAARTATYATMTVERFFPHARNLSVFIFGAGPVAERIVRGLAIFGREAFSRVIVRSRSGESASTLVTKLGITVPFSLVAVSDNRELRNCSLVITATNSKRPVFEDADANPHALTLHLGGDETPALYIQRVIKTGLVLCDDVGMVSRRNSQSVALYFNGGSADLVTLGPLLGVKSLSDLPDSFQKPPDEPLHITCVGLPMLDLYVAKYVWETFLKLPSAEKKPKEH